MTRTGSGRIAATALFALVLVGTMIAPASASTDWTNQTSGLTTTLFDAAFGTGTAGVAVGAGGKILTTSDGGSNWVARTSGTTNDLRSVTTAGPGGSAVCGSASDLPCYWAGGVGGTMLWSNDGGVTWCPQTSGTTEQINHLTTVGPNLVVAAGNKGTILESGSLGAARKCGAAGTYDTKTSGSTANLYGITDDGSRILAVGAGGTILQDAGSGFATMQSNTATDLFAVETSCDPSSCTAFDHHVVGAAGVMLKNTEGGAWAKQTSGTTQDLHDVMFADDVKGLAIGNRGTVVKTGNGGAVWTSEASGTCSDLLGMAQPDTKVVAVGGSGTIVAQLGSSTLTGPDCSKGFWMLGSDGGIFSFGDAAFQGSTGAITLNKPVVGMVGTPTGKGYWFVASDGGIFSFGDAKFFGSMGDKALNKPVVGMATTPTGKGYWLVASDGGIFSFGDAKFLGSTGAITLNKPVVGIASVAGVQSYWMVASDGGIFSFGPSAPFYGSTGNIQLSKPIVGMATAPSGSGYWFVASDGGIFSFGAGAPFLGAKLGGSPVAAMAPAADGQGYWIAHINGLVDHFGSAIDLGGLTTAPNKPVVGMASIRLG